ncbi:Scr1 family TA system antitoxin-like transcriptional regulator [Nonomuraea sp. NPDC049158]|uniref:Scr1 family TA system antitoxin-like transcriptional regulator n=1 Tax=Nonomuraea sp. NPDC049158 TaxID=3155649 RepID=UPI0034114F92
MRARRCGSQSFLTDHAEALSGRDVQEQLRSWSGHPAASRGTDHPSAAADPGHAARGHRDLGRGHPAEARITIYLIPFGAGGHTGLDGEFTVLDLPDEEDPPVVHQEGLTP